MVDDAEGRTEAKPNMATGGSGFDELFSRFSRLEAAFSDVMKAESSSEENRYLRKALAESFAVTESLVATVRQMQAEIDIMKRKIARYESENMTSSTISLYNDDAQKIPH